VTDLLVHLKRIPNRPRDLWLAQLGEGPCGVGDTAAEALERLAESIHRAADFLADSVIERLAGGEQLRDVLTEETRRP